jgi:hypothetical protein
MGGRVRPKDLMPILHKDPIQNRVFIVAKKSKLGLLVLHEGLIQRTQ